MKISGSSVLHAPPEKVWTALNDPQVLAGIIPGCDAFTTLDDGHFAMTVSLGVASIKGSYTGEVKLTRRVPPSSLLMVANGAGSAGFVDTEVAVTLTDLHDDTTRLDYDADATVGGMVGGVGQRVLASVARKTAGLFFTAVDDMLTGKRAVSVVPDGVPADLSEGEPAAAGFGAARADVGGLGRPGSIGPLRPGPPGPRRGPLALLGAAAFGALSMLVGVLVGARIARRRD
jgi:carbon monoxide dehydrogenase subunit G